MGWLAANQEEVNRLNVFPVPDGDTGTNMLLTLQSAVEDVRESNAQDVGRIAAIAAHGSLMGARGNSGVILSQIFRGFARAVQGKRDVGPEELAEAFQEAANAAYRAVNKPTEGTILTVAREAGKAASAAASEPGATARSVIQATAAGARAAVERTPSQLAILREAGVVDAGGYGLQVMLEGFLKSVDEGEAELRARRSARPSAAQVSMELPEEGWGYCTEFLISGSGLDVEDLRGRIADLGNSVLVVGEPELVKVHVHTDDPAAVLAFASQQGELQKVTVGDMSQQHRRILETEARGAPGPPAARADRANGVGIVAVAAGGGLSDVLRGLGADAIVEGGQTMNPSTRDMLEAVESVPYDEVILLPNNGNVILAASEVGKVTQKKVHVLPTRFAPQGVAALLTFNPEDDAAVNMERMRGAADHVQTIEVTHAVRDSRSSGLRVKKGDVIALINDKLSYSGRAYAEVVQKAIGGLGPNGFELVTIYQGEGASPDEVEAVTRAIRETFPTLEVENQAGGQQHYPFIVSVE